MPPTTSEFMSMERLDAFLREHREQLLGYIASKLSGRMQRVIAPEDIFQEVCIRTRRSWSGFRGTHERVLSSWVYTIAERSMLDELRKDRILIRGESGIIPDGQRESSLMDVWSRVSGEHPTPIELLSEQERKAEVQLAIADLSEQQARVVYMRLIEGVSQAEIAKRLRKSKSAVNSLLDAGKKRLNAILQERINRRWGSSNIAL